MKNTVKSRVEQALEIAKKEENDVWQALKTASFDEKDSLEHEWHIKFEIKMMLENIISDDMAFVKSLIATAGM